MLLAVLKICENLRADFIIPPINQKSAINLNPARGYLFFGTFYAPNVDSKKKHSNKFQLRDQQVGDELHRTAIVCRKSFLIIYCWILRVQCHGRIFYAF